MDAKMMEDDVLAVLKELPQDFVRDVVVTMTKHDLGKIGPFIIARLGKYVRLLAVEAMTGGIDQDEIADGLKKAVDRYMADVAATPPPKAA